MILAGPLNAKHLMLFDNKLIIDREDVQLAIVNINQNCYLLSSLSTEVRQIYREESVKETNTTGYTFMASNTHADKIELSLREYNLYKFIPGSTLKYEKLEVLHGRAHNLLLKYSQQFELNIIKGALNTSIMDKFGNKLASIKGINPRKVEDILKDMQFKLDMFVLGSQVEEFVYEDKHILLFHNINTNTIFCPYHNMISVRSKFYKLLSDYSFLMGKPLKLIRAIDIAKQQG